MLRIGLDARAKATATEDVPTYVNLNLEKLSGLHLLPLAALAVLSQRERNPYEVH